MNKIILILFLCVIAFLNNADSQIKKVLFEEFTNASCGPCAANNPALKAFIDSKGDSIVVIKYHTNFPGFDPMYNLNPVQVEERSGGYYSDVNAVPWLKGDGNMFPDIWPFTQANFDAAFNTRKVINPPLTISVTDARIGGDSVKTTITVSNLQTLPAGDYKLRIMGVEKIINYLNPPGNNGESSFEDVFRIGLPDMNGVQLPTAAGNYIFTFKYKIQPEWVDSNMVTTAFVQNDAVGKEVLNCNVAGDVPTGIVSITNIVSAKFSLYQNFPNPFNPSTTIKFDIPENSFVKLSIYNSLGKEVAVLTNELLVQGTYDYNFNASGLTSGLYFMNITSGKFQDTKKIMLLK